MGKFKVKRSPQFDNVFTNYPHVVRDKMQHLRELVIETAEQTEGITQLEETLKWGEPSFVTNGGSTLRMDWKPRAPNQYAMYFQCSTRLVETFRMVFGNKFQYEANRAIVFHLHQKIPVMELRQCIKATITYHSVKHLSTLGI